jgi:hypothetical protein
MQQYNRWNKNNGHANYNIDRDNYIGDSSLYARNDGQSNATDIGEDALYAHI